MSLCETNMSFYNPEWGFDGTTLDFTVKRKFRWLFKIKNVTSNDTSALPCFKASRPKISFREMQAEHLNETIYFPSKPDWQPVQIQVYDRCINVQNPIFTWLKQQYDPSKDGCSSWQPCLDPLSYKTCAFLQLMDGCGTVIEIWTFEEAYPQSIDWGELEMSSSDIVTVDFTLRYSRAYQSYPTEDHLLYDDDVECSTCEDSICLGASPPSTTISTLALLNSVEVPIIQVPDFIMI